MDRRANRHPGAPDRCGRRGDDRSRAACCSAGAGTCGRGRRGPRPDRRGDGDAGHDVPDHERPARGRAQRAGRCRLRPPGRLHGLHVRARAGLRDGRRRPGRPRAGGRWRRAVAPPRLERPLDVRAVRRRRRSRRARARPGRRLQGFRARRRRRRGHLSLAPSRRLTAAGECRHGRNGPALPEDERPRGLQVRDARARLVRGTGPPGVRPDYRRRGRLRPASGERSYHRPRCSQTGHTARAGGG